MTRWEGLTASGTVPQNESTGARRLSDTGTPSPRWALSSRANRPPRSSGRGATVERNCHSHCRQQQGMAWIHGVPPPSRAAGPAPCHPLQNGRLSTSQTETPPKATGRGRRPPSLFTYQSSGEPQGWKAGLFPDLASDPAGNSQGLAGPQHNRALFACRPPLLMTQPAARWVVRRVPVCMLSGGNGLPPTSP